MVIPIQPFSLLTNNSSVFMLLRLVILLSINFYVKYIKHASSRASIGKWRKQIKVALERSVAQPCHTAIEKVSKFWKFCDNQDQRQALGYSRPKIDEKSISL